MVMSKLCVCEALGPPQQNNLFICIPHTERCHIPNFYCGLLTPLRRKRFILCTLPEASADRLVLLILSAFNTQRSLRNLRSICGTVDRVDGRFCWVNGRKLPAGLRQARLTSTLSHVSIQLPHRAVRPSPHYVRAESTDDVVLCSITLRHSPRAYACEEQKPQLPQIQEKRIHDEHGRSAPAL